MSVFHNVFKVPKNDFKEEYLILFVEFDKNSKHAKINVLDVKDNSAWKCRLDDNLARPYYTKFELTADEYWQDIEEPLQQPSNSYQYWLDGQMLSLKKISTVKSITFEFFKVPISPVPLDDLKTSMINELIVQNSSLRLKNMELLEKNEKMTKEQDALKRELEKNTKEKIELEEKLYSRFVQILNAKKEKILELETKQRNTSDASKRQKLSENESSDEDGAYDQDTDVEDQPETTEMEDISESTNQSTIMKDILSL